MKHLFLLIFGLFSMSLAAQDVNEFKYSTGDTTYVMKKYFVCFLMAGDVKSQTEEEAAEIQKQHLAHIEKLGQEGKVMIAGPFEDGGDYRGILIFNAESIEQVVEWEGADPAVSSGRLKMKVLPWWAAKGSVLN
jgi:uncharacterized protein YciI